jgi:hypothetical protein
MATIQNINVGTTTNDGTGDTIRNSFIKTNDNFTSVNSDLSLKAPLASPTFTGTVNGVTKSMVGLSNVDNTSDVNKPISTSTQTALNLKAPLASPTFTGTVTTNSDASVNGIKVGKGGGNITTNTAIGTDALNSNTTGYYNTATGTASLFYNTTGVSNTANGSGALYFNTTGNYNTANGDGSLYSNTIGGNNTANGTYALVANTTGSFNTATGQGALGNNTVFNNISALGANAQVSASNQVQLGDSAATTYVYGTVQNRSDLRDKADVRDTVLGLDFISKLRPVDYKWDMREDYKTEAPSLLSQDATEEEKEAYKILMDEWLESVKLDNITHNGTNKRTRYHHGLIAQEVQDIIDETGVDFGGFQDHKISQGQDVLSIGYDELIAPMIKAIQELKAEIELLKAN